MKILSVVLMLVSSFSLLVSALFVLFEILPLGVSAVLSATLGAIFINLLYRQAANV